ncbi:MAG: hypothetical protein AAFS08_15315, partial [Pseudomonadota bacterium]
MNLRSRIELLRDDVRTLVDKEGTQIDPLRLGAELDRTLAQSDAETEHRLRKYNWRFELWKETKLELTKAVITFAQGVIRTLVLINGAAAIAIMTLIGGANEGLAAKADKMSEALLLFALGVASAALVGGLSYCTQFLYESSVGKISKLGVFLHIIAVVGAVVSLAFFV